MGLPAGQQRVLDSIEDALRAAEPKLASMFAIFARLTCGEARPAREELPDRHGLRSWSAASRPARTLRRVRARQLRRPSAGAPPPLMRRAAARPRRPRLRLLFIGQLMAVLAVLGLLIGLGTTMTPAACATQTGVSATAAHSRVVPAACRGGLGK
jgi:ferric-dicitrate binding protein FerR (iron transport regulator)